mmetsp:Transcript_5323/g.15504  ORF Transcript_5323/g.15504 Transcript_5323/m.15504 type:complete len:352 (+) Transcript_5323:459-1514(+)
MPARLVRSLHACFLPPCRFSSSFFRMSRHLALLSFFNVSCVPPPTSSAPSPSSPVLPDEPAAPVDVPLARRNVWGRRRQHLPPPFGLDGRLHPSQRRLWQRWQNFPPPFGPDGRPRPICHPPSLTSPRRGASSSQSARWRPFFLSRPPPASSITWVGRDPLLRGLDRARRSHVVLCQGACDGARLRRYVLLQGGRNVFAWLCCSCLRFPCALPACWSAAFSLVRRRRGPRGHGEGRIIAWADLSLSLYLSLSLSLYLGLNLYLGLSLYFGLSLNLGLSLYLGLRLYIGLRLWGGEPEGDVSVSNVVVAVAVPEILDIALAVVVPVVVAQGNSLGRCEHCCRLAVVVPVVVA